MVGDAAKSKLSSNCDSVKAMVTNNQGIWYGGEQQQYVGLTVVLQGSRYISAQGDTLDYQQANMPNCA